MLSCRQYTAEAADSKGVLAASVFTDGVFTDGVFTDGGRLFQSVTENSLSVPICRRASITEEKSSLLGAFTR